MKIRELFDPSKPISRRIEKVITYEITEESLLKQEIQEYVATESIERHLENLLDLLDAGMSGNTIQETGIWVSGFYGSGKSSFTKYLGFALDPDRTIDGRPFLEFLQNQISSSPLRQRLATVARRHPTSVYMIDLASQAMAGVDSISSVLYWHLMQKAGYSKDKKVAYLEFMLERDGRMKEFRSLVPEHAVGKQWEEIHNQPLMVKTVASKLASKFYGDLWPDPAAFNQVQIEEAEGQDERIREMLELIRRKSQNPNVIFILDEVGHYIAAREDLRTDLDGLAKNIKNLGHGHAWLVATAQQTLTEDDPRAQMNTARLFMLKDRFPISVDLEASDIKEIVWRRLLSKSAQGQTELARLYDEKGPALKFATELKGARYYPSHLDKESFCKLYPFLPQHFEILLKLLGRLSRTSGGVGLRSAIKVIQDVLVSEGGSASSDAPLGDQPLGTLATTVTFFNTLRRDIRRSFGHLVQGVDKVEKGYGFDSLESELAKTVALLQILEDLPATPDNVAALTHPRVDAQPRGERVKTALETLEKDTAVHLAQFEGSYRFLSEAVAELESQRNRILVRSIDIRKVQSDALREVFNPQPSARLENSRNVSAGLKLQTAGIATGLFGDREPIQMIVEFVGESEYGGTREQRTLDSPQKSNRNLIYVLARDHQNFRDLATEVYRSQSIVSQNRTRSEKEVEQYLRSQQDRSDRLAAELARSLTKSLLAGSFIFRGEQSAVAELGDQLSDAVRKQLARAAGRVYEKYSQAALAGDSGLAERFLKTAKLDRIASADDPLSLVRTNGTVDEQNSALLSIRNYLEQRGAVEGKRLLDEFYDPPYGWSKDITRYLVAALLAAGQLKLRISGEDVTVKGPVAIESLKNTSNFNKITIALRDAPPDPDLLLRAAGRLLELTGEKVMPLEDDLSRAVMKHFPEYQQRYAPLETRLQYLNLSGVERTQDLQRSIAEILKGDASDAASRLGGEECPLFDDLNWARRLKIAFDNGIDRTVRAAQALCWGIPRIPDLTRFQELKEATREERETIEEWLRREDFFEMQSELENALREIRDAIAAAARDFTEAEQGLLAQSCEEIMRMPEWSQIGLEDQDRLSLKLKSLELKPATDLEGINSLLDSKHVLTAALAAIRREVEELAKEGRDPEIEEVSLSPPRGLVSADQLAELVSELDEVRRRVERGEKIIICWK